MVAAKISGVAGATPPLLRRIQLRVNKEGVFDRVGLPVCTLEEIQPTTNEDALAACGGSLVGEGEFSAEPGADHDWVVNVPANLLEILHDPQQRAPGGL